MRVLVVTLKKVCSTLASVFDWQALARFIDENELLDAGQGDKIDAFDVEQIVKFIIGNIAKCVVIFNHHFLRKIVNVTSK